MGYERDKGKLIGVFYFSEMAAGDHLEVIKKMKMETGLPEVYTEAWCEHCVPIGAKIWLAARADKRIEDRVPSAEYLEKAKSLIDEYCKKEYGNEPEPDRYADLHDVGIAYTDYTAEEWFDEETLDHFGFAKEQRSVEVPLQVSVDLINLCMKTTLGDRIMDLIEFEDEDAMLEALDGMDFDALVSCGEYDEDVLAWAFLTYNDNA